jgi:hypothetical protein
MTLRHKASEAVQGRFSNGDECAVDEFDDIAEAVIAAVVDYLRDRPRWSTPNLMAVAADALEREMGGDQ